MSALQIASGIAVQNILFLTDFSEPSKRAAITAEAAAQFYGATVHALHVLLPHPYVYMTPDVIAAVNGAKEQTARARMQQVAASLQGCQFQSSICEAQAIWPVLEETIQDKKIDLIILGTHGRTGVAKLAFGSATEEIIRKAAVPVLTVGPMVPLKHTCDAIFKSVLCPTDFKNEGSLAASYATWLAQDNDAQLVLLHVIRQTSTHKNQPGIDVSVANAMHNLQQLLPRDTEFFARPKMLVEHGEPAKKILEVVESWAADIIVMGAPRSPGVMQSATHLETSAVHQVIANATCAVLTIAN